MIIIQPHTQCVNVVCFNLDGSLLASVSEDGYAKVWDPAQLHTSKPIWEVDAESDDDEVEEDELWWLFGNTGLSHAQFTPDGKWLITSGWNRHLRAWNAKTGKAKWEVRKPKGYGGVGTLVVSRDGKHIAFAGGHMGIAERVYILDPKNETEVRSVKGHDDACGALAAGPDGFVSGSADKHVKFWTWTSNRCYHDMALRGVVRGLMFAPDGSRLAASGGAVVMVWDMQAPERKNAKRKPGKARHFRGHTDQVQAIDFSPDGTMIASAAHDGTVRTWDAASGAEIRAYAPQVGKLHHVAFAPDGLTLAFTSEKGHVGLFDLDS
jgi:WD40 repeat protein